MSKSLMRGLFGFLLLVAGSVATGQVHQHVAEDPHEDSFSFPGGGSFTLDVEDGDLILEGWDKEGVQIEAIKRVRSFQKSDVALAEELVDQIDLIIEVDTRGNELNIRTENPSGCRGVDCRVDFRIFLPRRHARTDDGEVRFTGLEGSVRVMTDDGDIILREITGDINAHTDDGDVEVLVAPRSAVVIRTDDGDIRLALVLEDGDEPKILVRQDDGDIDSELPFWTSKRSFDEAPGSPEIRLQTDDGDIRIFRRSLQKAGVRASCEPRSW